MARLLEIDGSMGEGGGQILRTAVALSAVLGKPIRIYNIRAKRSNPGLRPQHLNAVRAVASICNARVEGASVGSRELIFIPGEIKGGSLYIDIGTAGSISLVLQALLPAAAFSPRPVRLRIRGGTDVKMAPTIDYMREVLTRLLSMMGYRVEIRVLRRGHYPRGGGLVEAIIPDPPNGFKARNFTERGKLKGIWGRSHAVKLPRHVAERQARSASMIIEERLGVRPDVEVEAYEPDRDPHLGPGSGVTLWAVFEDSVMGSDALGERGKRAEVVGSEAAVKLVEDIKTGAVLDRHAGDMIPVYLALTGRPTEIFGAKLTMHTVTIFKLLELFIEDFKYEIQGDIDKPFKARIY
ncbi:MAG: RNA 3'-terminal phosphate cyclase [Desulfurococcales archaeon]|nr:RNA 3'-terminal phosphate cyclase [Desulfurococcales archaeon]